MIPFVLSQAVPPVPGAVVTGIGCSLFERFNLPSLPAVSTSGAQSSLGRRI